MKTSKMPRFYLPPKSVDKEDKVLIKGEEAHHILRVMRLKPQDKITLFDGTGKEYFAVIEEAGHQELTVRIKRTQEFKVNGEVSICLAQAIPKKQKFDLIVEKATELGAEEIIPLITERTIAKLDFKNASIKQARWHKIALEAAKQCGRAKIPSIGAIQKFSDLITKQKDFDLRLIFCIGGERKQLKEILKEKRGVKNILVLIGPEGDFSPQEVKAACENGCLAASLGKSVLKTDTASYMSLSILHYEYNL